MRRHDDARTPDAWRQDGGRAAGQAGNSARHADFTPVALAVYKPGRGRHAGWCIVSKLTRLTGQAEPVLAVVWRSQRGTTDMISVPQAVITYARAAGARWFYLRDDRRRAMSRTPLEALERGILGAGDGERYVRLDDMEQVPWRDWEYAERVVRLGAHGDGQPARVDDNREQAQQLTLAL
ncbi:MAG: hypothetical protein HY689_15700 [Chloroflexi bacterium]|nr:hypothetical protein [Chloroflexota bacterium]